MPNVDQSFHWKLVEYCQYWQLACSKMLTITVQHVGECWQHFYWFLDENRLQKKNRLHLVFQAIRNTLGEGTMLRSVLGIASRMQTTSRYYRDAIALSSPTTQPRGIFCTASCTARIGKVDQIKIRILRYCESAICINVFYTKCRPCFSL